MNARSSQNCHEHPNGKQSRKNLAHLPCPQQVFRKYKQLLWIYSQYEGPAFCKPLPENTHQVSSSHGSFSHCWQWTDRPSSCNSFIAMYFYNVPSKKSYFYGKMVKLPLRPSTGSPFPWSTSRTKHKPRNLMCLGHRTEAGSSRSKDSGFPLQKTQVPRALPRQGVVIPCPNSVEGWSIKLPLYGQRRVYPAAWWVEMLLWPPHKSNLKY